MNARILHRDRGTHLESTLYRGNTPVRSCRISYAGLARALRPHMQGAELGWSFKHFIRGLKRGAKKLASKTLRNVIKPIGKAWIKVESAIRPIGKKIPVIGFFARLHEKYVAPITRKLFGAKEAHKRAKTPKEKARARHAVNRWALLLTAAKQRILRLTAKMNRAPKAVQRAVFRAAMKAGGGSYTVVLPTGESVRVPAHLVA